MFPVYANRLLADVGLFVASVKNTQVRFARLQSLGLHRHKPGHRLVGLGDDDFPLAVARSTWPVFALGHEPFRLCRE